MSDTGCSPNQSSTLRSRLPPSTTGYHRLHRLPLLIVWEVLIVDSAGVLDDGGILVDHLLGVRGSIKQLDAASSARVGVETKGTYAVQMSTETMNPNRLVSASVGSVPPRTQNGPSPLASFRALSSSPLTLSQISARSAAISSAECRPVPWPFSVAIELR